MQKSIFSHGVPSKSSLIPKSNPLRTHKCPLKEKMKKEEKTKKHKNQTGDWWGWTVWVTQGGGSRLDTSCQQQQWGDLQQVHGQKGHWVIAAKDGIATCFFGCDLLGNALAALSFCFLPAYWVMLYMLCNPWSFKCAHGVRPCFIVTLKNPENYVSSQARKKTTKNAHGSLPLSTCRKLSLKQFLGSQKPSIRKIWSMIQYPKLYKNWTAKVACWVPHSASKSSPATKNMRTGGHNGV